MNLSMAAWKDTRVINCGSGWLKSDSYRVPKPEGQGSRNQARPMLSNRIAAQDPRAKAAGVGGIGHFFQPHKGQEIPHLAADIPAKMDPERPSHPTVAAACNLPVSVNLARGVLPLVLRRVVCDEPRAGQYGRLDTVSGSIPDRATTLRRD